MLPVRLAAALVRRVCPFDPPWRAADAGFGSIGLARRGLNPLGLLPQDALRLALAHLLANQRPKPRADLRHLKLSADHHRRLPQPGLDVEFLEELLFFG